MNCTALLFKAAVLIELVGLCLCVDFYSTRKYSCYVCKGEVHVDASTQGQHCFAQESLVDSMIESDCATCVKTQGKDEYSNFHFVSRSCMKQLLGTRLVRCGEAQFAGVDVNACHCKGDLCNQSTVTKPVTMVIVLAMCATWFLA